MLSNLPIYEGLISCEEAANSFNVTEKKLYDTIKSTDLKQRIKRVCMKKETLKHAMSSMVF